ncbi:MAG: thioredoxin [Gammaproteobacteria bacterium]|nr:thioredoxin [Gammaproteobacteria bacterium]MDH5176491.1 thioredoxin [Gammaproteobacteria bacterium]MDH5226056.1 thioredoxin [Gammaproteobacteria bacterium]
MTATARKIDATVENFMTVVVEASNTTPVLVDFWAPWCGPCRTLMPLLDRIADDYAGRFILAKVNTEEQTQLASHFQIRSIPTVMLVHHGEVVEQFMGLQPEAAIRALLDRHVPPAGEAADVEPAAGDAGPATSGRPEEVAAQLLQRRDAGGAAAAIEALAAAKADHPALPALRARLTFVETANAQPDVVALRTALEANPADPAARHALAAHHAAAGDYATALAEWLDLMRRNRTYGDDVARRSLLQAFDVLGEQHELVAQYRRRMASLLH